MSENDSSHTTDPVSEATPDPDERISFWHRRKRHFHIGFWSLFVVALIGLFLAMASMSLTGRSVSLPDWISSEVEEQLNAAMPEGAIALRRVEIGVTKAGRPRLRLVDVVLRDASGLEVAQLNSVEGGVRLAPLFKGELVPRTAILSGAQITFRRLADGTFALQFGQGSAATGSLGEMLDTMDETFAGFLAEASRVQALGLTITLEDARSGRLWQVTNGNMTVEQTDTLVETEVAFDVFNQTDELAAVTLGLRSAKATSEASLSISFENAAAADIGAQSPALSFLTLIDAPVNGALRTTIGPDGAITDLAGALSIDEGAIKPTPGAKPVKFGGAKGYLDYNPEENMLALSGMTLTSDLGEAELDGQLYLTETGSGWPQAIVGQFHLNHATLVDPRLFDEPLEVTDGYADLRLRLSPFELDIGQVVLFRGDTRYQMTGRVGATREAWDLALDVTAPSLTVDELKKVWPKTVSQNARRWMIDNVASGNIHDVHMAFRGPTLNHAAVIMGGRLTESEVTFMPAMPPAQNASGHLSLADREFVVTVEAGTVTAPQGGKIDATGTTFTIPNVQDSPGVGIAKPQLSGPLEAGLALLNLPPLNALKGTGFEPDFASGRFSGGGTLSFPLTKEVPFDLVEFDMAGEAFDLSSDELVPGSTVTAERLSFTATPAMLTVSGPAKIGEVAARGTWRQPLGKEAATLGSVVDGTVELSQTLVDEFNLGLEDGMVGGSAPARVTLSLVPKSPPKLELTSEMVGLSLSIPGTTWRKSTKSSGALELTAVLGARPEVTEMSIRAPGLRANGRITTKAGGQLDRVTFQNVKLDNWLDAPVTIVGRGNRPIAINVNGGQANLSKAGFSEGSSSGASGPKVPISIKLNRLVIAEGIVLRNFDGQFELGRGPEGTFTATVRDGGPIEGTVAQAAQGTAYRITAKNGGRVLKGIGVFEKARGGDLEVVLAPTGIPGTFEGDMKLTYTRLVDAPAMAEMLAAISVVGLIDQLDGQGISFSEVKARFRLDPDRVTLYSSSAISASLGLSLDGYYNLNDNTMDMQGVLSPFYIINSLGRIVSVRDGEGLLGFNFNLNGPSDDVNVEINPLSILTPGFLREIFRREAPVQPGTQQQ